jgi:hypothetical protein
MKKQRVRIIGAALLAVLVLAGFQGSSKWIDKTGKSPKYIWFPKLAVTTRSGGLKPGSKGFRNVLHDDWTRIDEYDIRDGAQKKKRTNLLFDNSSNKIAVFAKYKNALGQSTYRFIGVFRKTRTGTKRCYKREHS